MRRPTKQSVDALVQAAVENLRTGRVVEDDTGLELKGEWPEPEKKARQLAAAANALRGEPLIYAIGVDDKTGLVTTPAKIEVQDWSSRMAKQFDQIAPALLWSQTVYVGDDAESVQVLVFDTSDFPYLVKVAGGDRLEVPIRRGTATRSARRSDLIRIMAPRIAVPQMRITSAKLDAKRETSRRKSSATGELEPSGRVTGWLQIDIFVEKLGGEPTTLPVEQMHGRIRHEDSETRFPVHVKELGSSPWPVMTKIGDAPPPRPVPPQYGVYALDRHVIATAPGTFTIATSVEFEPEALAAPGAVLTMERLLAASSNVGLDVILRVVGAEHDVALTAVLRRRDGIADSHDESRQAIGAWILELATDDPWS